MEDAATLAREYRDLQSAIKALEDQSEVVRGKLKIAISFEKVTEPKTWVFPDEGVGVVWVKGRTTEKLDRTKLMQAGVTKEQMEKGTVKSTFPPTMRVVAAESLDSNEG